MSTKSSTDSSTYKATIFRSNWPTVETADWATDRWSHLPAHCKSYGPTEFFSDFPTIKIAYLSTD